MKEKEELVLVGHQMFHGGGGLQRWWWPAAVVVEEDPSFLQRFCHLRLFQQILISGICRELKKKKFKLCLK